MRPLVAGAARARPDWAGLLACSLNLTLTAPCNSRIGVSPSRVSETVEAAALCSSRQSTHTRTRLPAHANQCPALLGSHMLSLPPKLAMHNWRRHAGQRNSSRGSAAGAMLSV